MDVQPPGVRENATCIRFYKTDGDSLYKLFREHASDLFINYKDFQAKCARYWKDRYSYVYINKIDGITTNDIFNNNY